MAPTNLEKAVADRESTTDNIAYLEEKLASNAETRLTSIEVSHLLELAKSAQVEVQEINRRIRQCAPADPSEHVTIYMSLCSRILKLVAGFTGLQMAFIPSTTTSEPNSQRQEIKLPKLEIPVFEGKIHEWVSFRDLFVNTIHNKANISKSEKMAYLKSLLKGDAARLIQTLVVTDANYDIAWQKPIDRYQNERELVSCIFQRFLNQPQVQADSGSHLRELIDISLECVRSLDVFSFQLDKGLDAMLMFQLFWKLDAVTKQLWEQSLKDTKVPKFHDLVEFLEARARSLSASHPSLQQAAKPQFKAKLRNHSHHATRSWKCKCCASFDFHPISKCVKYKGLSIADREKTAHSLNLCLNCLKEGHRVSNCPSQNVCFKCKEKHHTLLHKDSSSSSMTMHNHSPAMIQTIFATAQVDAIGPMKRKTARVFFDNGSSDSYITEKLAKAIGLRFQPTNVEVSGLGVQSVGMVSKITNLSISSIYEPQVTLNLSAFVIPVITRLLPSETCNPRQWPHLKNLQLADPQFYKSAEVDILVGGDVLFQILRDGRREGPKDTPTAIKSTFGWLVSGRSTVDTPQYQAHYSDSTLSRQVEKFWKLEDIPKTKFNTAEENLVENHFMTHFKVDDVGRYNVQIPWKVPMPSLGESKGKAHQRLLLLERRLSRLENQHGDLKARTEYHKFMQEYLDLRHMEKVPMSEVVQPKNHTFYIPHHFVLKSESTTTKFRVVFDGSAKSSTGLSLNDAMMVGPCVQDSLMGILLRFRLYKYAMTADIAKMYRQIRISEEDSDMHRILWRFDENGPISEYRLLTVTYGTAAAPFLATRVLNQLASDYEADYPIGSQILRDSFYIDDLMCSFPTVQEASKAQTEITGLIQRGNMQLRKWTTNCPEVLTAIPKELRENRECFDINDVIKALGISWSPSADSFRFHFALQVGEKGTKREILSILSKIFDPLGWLAPVTVKGKVFIQALWAANVNWDEPIDANLLRKWKHFITELNNSSFEIQRCMIPNETSEIKLYGFSDASEKAYGAVVYLVSYSEEKPTISLLSAKTRVAPLKVVSLPRLELCAALLLSRLIESCKTMLKCKINDVLLYTDSQIVLHWINSTPSRWKCFVANRVSIIQEITSMESWHYVKSSQNPADIASRGMSPAELSHNTMWWTGPSWLQGRVHDHVREELTYNSEDIHVEERIATTNLHATSNEEFLVNRYSTLGKLKRVTAYVLRFLERINPRFAGLNKCQDNACQEEATGVGSLSGRECGLGAVRFHLNGTAFEVSRLSAEEIERALLTLVKVTQQHFFHDEYTNLLASQELPRKSNLLSLCPFLDSEGFLRVGGRLSNSSLLNFQKHPYLLPRKSKLTELLIEDSHISNYHGGAQLVHSLLINKFWIIKGRMTIRNVISKCIRCRRFAAATATQIMADLPASRVTPSYPFSSCGVDYAGPFLLRPGLPRSRVTIKGYLAIFVCFSTKAVHLEAVSNLSTEAFLATLKRFTSRRGLPNDIYSDNATNFQGASRELKDLCNLMQSQEFQEEVSKASLNQGINWHFIPPAAPHFGGLWEAGVKSSKYHLRRIIGGQILTFEEFSTVLSQVEACLNSRPITPLSGDPNDLTALTPGHFLVGRPLRAVPEMPCEKIPVSHLKRWEMLQKITQDFWRRWSTEYLSRLQQRPKWRQPNEDIKIGDLVIIRNESLPPQQWMMGRITELHPGRDNKVRVATVMTSSGKIKRPIVKLCILPLTE